MAIKAPTKYNLEISATLEMRANWQVRMDAAADPDDPTFYFELARPEPGNTQLRIKERDAVDVRDEFLSIKKPEDAFVFFRNFGPWQVEERLATKAAPFKWSQIQQSRRLFEEGLLISRPGIQSGGEVRDVMERMWMWGNLALELPFQEPLAAYSRCDDIQSALRASVYLSRLAGSQWSRCAKTDCGKLFERKNKRPQLYCTPEHANIQSTRNALARQESTRAAKQTKPAKAKRKKAR